MIDEKKIIEAVKRGANTIKEIALETKIDYQDVLTWVSKDDNAKLVERLSYEPVWKAKKKVLEDADKDTANAKWILTHHKDAKSDWSDRIEHTGKDGETLPVLVQFIDGKNDNTNSE